MWVSEPLYLMFSNREIDYLLTKDTSSLIDKKTMSSEGSWWSAGWEHFPQSQKKFFNYCQRCKKTLTWKWREITLDGRWADGKLRGPDAEILELTIQIEPKL